jgi:hypothetical protein
VKTTEMRKTGVDVVGDMLKILRYDVQDYA